MKNRINPTSININKVPHVNFGFIYSAAIAILYGCDSMPRNRPLPRVITPFSLCCAMEGPTTRTGPLLLVALLRNISSESEGIPAAEANRFMTVEVFKGLQTIPRARGARTAAMDKNRSMAADIAIGSAPIRLLPGESAEYTVNLRNEFQIRDDGDYLAVLSYRECVDGQDVMVAGSVKFCIGDELNDQPKRRFELGADPEVMSR